ncbi:hypothetical protein [Natrinema versiforme]|uniref:Uncharacterized protein n=1 Tax=Natrinema versiforme TaxID=88724 RepID=A0A4P8WFX2_9EURY|nr:hypothetical protein [Natrinema versiforme]QCS42248.1 hypothetical protein FEJ81_07710 [Natrinema versiforme]
MDTEARRAAAVCTECDNVIAVRILRDETVQPIGIDGQCACGNETYRVLGTGTEAVDEDAGH